MSVSASVDLKLDWDIQEDPEKLAEFEARVAEGEIIEPNEWMPHNYQVGMLRMAEHFAHRLEPNSGDLESCLRTAYRLALGRDPSREEMPKLIASARRHGFPSTCRLIFNLNEFCFVD